MNEVNLYDLAKKINDGNKDKSDIDKTYNKIKYLYNNLINDDIFEFKIEKFSEYEQTLFLAELLKIMDSQKDFFNTENAKKVPNRNILGNLKKEDMDLELEILIDSFIKTEHKSPYFTPNLPSIKGIYYASYENKSMIRHHLRHSIDNCEKSLQEAYEPIIEYANSADEELNLFKGNGLENLKQEMLVTYLIEDTCSYLFLQGIIYLIIKNNVLDSIQKKKSMLDIYELIKNINNNEEFKCDKENFGIFNSFAVYLFKLNRRNELKNYIDIIEVLEQEMNEDQEKFKDVNKEYMCNQRWIKEIKTKKELMNIILEGKEEKIERFNEKLQRCNKVIEFLRNNAGRELYEDYLQHIKVVYREVIESKIKYNNKSANTIVRNLLKTNEAPKFTSIKESLFIREKLSRGFFREDGLIEVYKLKNYIQKELYKITLKIYDNTDLVFVRRTFINIYSEIFKVLMKTLKGMEKIY
ncbi:hypothetical protein [Clostridium sp.]|uniref:hypothetical protein n=1 Tax=Clostridium sp. TaxID=1506 RepID=UPI002FC6C3E5